MNSAQRIVKLYPVTALLVALFTVSIVPAAGQKAIKTYPIPEHGMLELNVPTSWKDEIHKPQENMPPTILFTPAKGNDFQVMITVMWGKKGDQDFNNQQRGESDPSLKNMAASS